MNRRTAAIVVHVDPGLKARLLAAADDAGLKLSPFVYMLLKQAMRKEP